MSELIPISSKIFIIPYPYDYYYAYSCPRTRLACQEGLSALEGVELVEDSQSADFYLLNYVPHEGKDKYNKNFIAPYTDPTKLIVYDMQDENESYLVEDNEYLVYFKRSWFDLDGKPKERPAKMFPTAYTMLDGYLNYPIVNHLQRSIDVGVYLRSDSPNRCTILRVFSQLQQMNPQLNIHVGSINNGNRSSGENVEFNDEYFFALSQTKINIHCDPTNWIGDSRFHESISQCCLTFTNTRFDHLPNPYINEKHIIQYNIWNIEDLTNKVGYYLNRPELISQIGWQGYLHGHKHWQSKHIMEYVIDTAKRIKNENNNRK